MPVNSIIETVNTATTGLSGGSVVGGVVALAMSLGWWMRRERVESAKTNKEVAAANASTDTYEAQATEIAAVRERLSTIEAAYVKQSLQIAELLKKLSEMEARLIGASAHHDNLILCDVCLGKNDRVLAALSKTLSTSRSDEDHSH